MLGRSSTSVIVVLCLALCSHAFYIPGVAPTEFSTGDAIEIKVLLGDAALRLREDRFLEPSLHRHASCRLGCVVAVASRKHRVNFQENEQEPMGIVSFFSRIVSLFVRPEVTLRISAERFTVCFRSQVVKLTSNKSPLPYEYYHLPFCQPDKIERRAENLGMCCKGTLMNSELVDLLLFAGAFHFGFLVCRIRFAFEDNPRMTWLLELFQVHYEHVGRSDHAAAIDVNRTYL